MSSDRVKNAGVTHRYVALCQLTLHRAAQAARLMVGVGDYQRYVNHMASHHPDAQVMSEKDYFRYCQNSRYPGKDGSIKRCPC